MVAHRVIAIPDNREVPQVQAVSRWRSQEEEPEEMLEWWAGYKFMGCGRSTVGFPLKVKTDGWLRKRMKTLVFKNNCGMAAFILLLGAMICCLQWPFQHHWPYHLFVLSLCPRAATQYWAGSATKEIYWYWGLWEKKKLVDKTEWCWLISRAGLAVENITETIYLEARMWEIVGGEERRPVCD